MDGPGRVAIRALDSVDSIIGGAAMGTAVAGEFLSLGFILPLSAVPAFARIVQLQIEVIGGPFVINQTDDPSRQGASLVVTEVRP